MIQAKYRSQVDLLLSILPHVAKEESLALNGGTAINLFVRDMPRLSVDIDLTYTNWKDDRATALQNISSALDRIEDRIKKSISPISITRVPEGQGQDVKLNCQTQQAHIKIEVNTTIRGVLFPVRMMQVTDSVQNDFKKFAAINVVSHAELFGGKICAALDRQHPRDLFDIYLLFQNEGFHKEIKLGFIISLLSHARPVHELLSPHLLDQRHAFDNQFSGMTATPFAYDAYEETREELIARVKESLTESDKKFLLSFTTGEPKWELLPLKNLEDLPAVQWKLMNIQNLKVKNEDKYLNMLKALEGNLGIRAE
jgi:predicted nucleotidyltransferase component of viral defense system